MLFSSITGQPFQFSRKGSNAKIAAIRAREAGFDGEGQ
jgi:hypothetical protein